MNREEVRNICLEESNKYKCLLLNLPTGYGKSKLAIDLINHICDNHWRMWHEETSVLLLVAKSVHKKNWLEEINKWGGLKTDNITIECYESLKKYENVPFDIVVLDECHHLSDARKDILGSITISENIIGLSATIPNNLVEWFNDKYETKVISTSLQEAIDNNVLPEPTIYLIPLQLKGGIPTEYIYKNPKAKGQLIECCWANRWQYIRQKKYPVRIACNESQYIQDLNGQIEWLKKRSMRSQAIKNKWLRVCNDRLKWLSSKKESYILSLLDYFKNYRTLTFCNSIEQSELLGKNCIHSKNKDSQEILEKFNNKKIKHITSCLMVNEGMNLVDCRIGIYAVINSSEIINKQKFGRLLRHKKPIIIIPYYANTREEEIVKDIIQDYNKELIKTIKDFKEIEL